MTLRASLIVVALLAPALSHAASTDDPYNIMKPEPRRGDDRFRAWRPLDAKPDYSKLKARRRGSSNPVYPTALPKPDHFRADAPITARPSLRTVQPYGVEPLTGRALPNLDVGRSETGQDRAVRCAHQAGIYAPQIGAAGSNPSAYIGSCVNQ
ncbi:MAG: hypothetical protein JO205_10180 [Pseudolabrys sp.]|nr:hypothetical protein [Pseudolabrys sp.]